MPRPRPARLLAADRLRRLSHFGLITLGIYGLTFTGGTGAVYQILSDGVVDGAIFLLLGALELRYGTSEIDSYGGLAAKLPRAATFFVIAALAMIGLPMLSSFIGEFTILSATFALVSQRWAVAATLGVILSASYMLWLVQRLFYGPESALATSRPPADLRFSELSILTPLAVLMLVIGLAPNLWLNSIQTGLRRHFQRNPPRTRYRKLPHQALSSRTGQPTRPNRGICHAHCHPDRRPSATDGRSRRICSFEGRLPPFKISAVFALGTLPPPPNPSFLPSSPPP